jgi:transcriptional regulator with XRE-family HTH domain
VEDAAELGAAVRNARIEQELSQVELAEDARVGRQWLVGFEAGDKASAPFDMVMRVLRALNLEVVLDPRTPTRRYPDLVFPPPTASEVLVRFSGEGPLL